MLSNYRSRLTSSNAARRVPVCYCNQKQTTRKEQSGGNNKDDCKIADPALAAENSRDSSTSLPYHDNLQKFLLSVKRPRQPNHHNIWNTLKKWLFLSIPLARLV
jgi:hypothetical protein